MDLYRPDGQPDITRARQALALAERRAEARVRAEVEPLRQTAATTLADSIRQRAYDAKDKFGRPFASREAIDQTFNLVPAHLVNADTGRLLLMLAAAAENTNRPPQSQPAPAFTETSGGRVGPGSTELSSAERFAMKRTGMSEAEWNKQFPAGNGTGWELE